MNSGLYGFPNILGLLRATAFKAIGKSGATAGAVLAGGTASGAPTTGTFDAGDLVLDQSGQVRICTAGGTPGTWALAGDAATVPTRWEPITTADATCLITAALDPVMALASTAS